MSDDAMRAAMRPRLLACTILLVDDEEANLDLLEALLEGEGYSALVRIDDAREVADAIARHRPDVVLLDLHMPHRHGLDLLRELRATTPPDEYLPVLVLTADVTPEAKERALRAGARDFLTKPFDTLEVVLRVENLLETRLLYADQRAARLQAERAEARAALLAEWSRRLEASLDTTTALAQLPDLLVPAWGSQCVVLGADGRSVIGSAGAAGANGLEAAMLSSAGDGWASARAVHVRQLPDGGTLHTLVAPVTAGSSDGAQRVATLVLTRRQRPYDADDEGLVLALAERAGLAAERTRLFAAAELATRERERLLAVVAHDLRNPLSVVTMYAEMAANAHPDGLPGASSDDLRHALRTIHRNTTGMQVLVEDLLDAATVREGAIKLHVGAHDAVELFAQVERSLRPLAATRGLTLVVSGIVEPSAATVHADAGRLGQVLSNLVGNAIKFSPSEGTVRVDWQSREAGLVVAVSDEGMGISAEALPHVFTAYWQGGTHDRRGAGLGLWIAQAIVEGHGGAIEVESTPGRGTTFRFTLPSLAGAPQDPT